MKGSRWIDQAVKVGESGRVVGYPTVTKVAMSQSYSQTNQSTDPRDDYIIVGRDGRGAHHCYDTTTETVHIVHSDGSRERKILGQHSINDYIEAVETSFGWQSQRLFKTFADFATDRL